MSDSAKFVATRRTWQAVLCRKQHLKHCQLMCFSGTVGNHGVSTENGKISSITLIPGYSVFGNRGGRPHGMTALMGTVFSSRKCTTY